MEFSSFSLITADVPTSPVCTVTTSPIFNILEAFSCANLDSRKIGSSEKENLFSFISEFLINKVPSVV